MADTTVQYSGHIQEFIPANSDWSIYKRRLQNYFTANDIKNDDRKRAILLSLLNEEAYKLLYNMCIPSEPENKPFKDIISLMDIHFKPVVSIFASREKFFEARKMANESPKEWAARLRNLVSVCNFGGADEIEKALVNRFIVGYDSGSVKNRLYEEKETVSFLTAVEIASSKSVVPPYCQANVKKESEIHYAGSTHKKFTQGHPSTSRAHTSRSSNASGISGSSGGAFQHTKCAVCGRKNHKADKCSYRNCYCHICNKKGHLAPMCPNKNMHNKNKSNKNNTTKNNFLESEDYSLYSLECFNNFVSVNLSIENKSYTFYLDTGASYTVISDSFYEQNFKNLPLKPTDRVFIVYNGDRILPLGFITCHVKYRDKNLPLDIFVISNGGPPLLGRDFFNLFGLTIGNLNYVDLPMDLEFILEKYKDLFSPGLGTFNKGMMTIKMKSEQVSPKFFRARPLPFAIRDKVEEELKRLSNLGVIEPVEYSEWGTPIVPVLKKNGTVRICGDFKVTVNPFIEIDPFPLPRIEDLFVKLQGGVHFSKLDLANAYQQVCLDEKSKDLVTISTHKGLFKYNRVPFGIASIPAKFQKMLETILQGLDGVVCFLDDIVVTGRDRSEHISRLEEVLTRLQNSGLKLSIEKCNFFQNMITYLGYDIDKQGLHTSQTKISAMINAPIPHDVTSLKSFLGLINYYGKFVKNLSTILHPLYRLLKANSDWEWTDSCQNAFEEVKGLLSSAPVLVHYDPDLPLRLSTDASQYGLGAVISHILPDGSEKPIAYSSRTLTPAEVKYSQLEKEGASVIFGLCKFNTYLLGRKFTLLTDHKPLTYIFHPHKGIPQFSANRLRRWAMILSNYQYDIEYVRSENNQADCFSRLPEPLMENSLDDVDINFINYFKENSHFPIHFQNVREATLKDKVLSQVLKYVRGGWPVTNKIAQDVYFKSFYRIKNELSVESDCLMWNNRIVIPSILQNEILRLLHATHMGVVKMKSLARSYFWWPGLDKNIEEICKTCENCLLNKKAPDKAILDSWPWPEKPWSRLHLDFMGPFLNKQFLIIVDAHSKWLEVFPMNSITSNLTIEILRTCFARFGLPEQIVTDNGTSFCSREFEEFLSNNNIVHITTPPYHPSSNGAAENSVKTIKNALTNAFGKNTNVNINKVINNFLFDYRNTPHCTTKCTPAKLLFGRELRTRFDMLLPKNETDLKDRVLREQRKQKKYYAGKRFVEFDRGEIVTVKDYRIVNKVKWIKAVIFKRIGKATYIVIVPELNDVKWKRHLNQIKKFHIIDSEIPDVTDVEKVLFENQKPEITADTNTYESNVASSSKETNLSEKLRIAETRPKRTAKPPERLIYS